MHRWHLEKTNKQEKTSQTDIHKKHVLVETEHSVSLTLPDCSMDRASRDTEIFSSEVLIQSNMPLQPFMGKVKFAFEVVGRLWMLSTDRDKEVALHQLICFCMWRTLQCQGHFGLHGSCVTALSSCTKSRANVTFTQPKRSHHLVCHCDFTGWLWRQPVFLQYLINC